MTSPFTDFTARVAIDLLLVGVLVSVLLIGGFLILNLGLLVKRPQDRRGERGPSDLGVFSDSMWPQEAHRETVLPAEEEEAEEKEPKKEKDEAA